MMNVREEFISLTPYFCFLPGLGKQAIVLEVTKNIISSQPPQAPADPFGRQPFEHPSLAGLENFAVKQPHDVISREALHKLGMEVGLLKVLRWKPRLVSWRSALLLGTPLRFQEELIFLGYCHVLQITIANLLTLLLQPENLPGSGVQVVLSGAIHAVIGAIQLQHGAEVASRVIQEKLLKRLPN